MHFPIFGWLGRPLGQGANPDTLANVIAVLAMVKILCSMTWFVIVGLQPSMGVAWHRFLAFITIYARKHDDGTSALGPLEPMIVDGNQFPEVDVTVPEGCYFMMGEPKQFCGCPFLGRKPVCKAGENVG